MTITQTTQQVEAPALVRVEGVSKSFGRVRALDRVSLAVGSGEFFCLLGPSGCGKSTLLRLLAGFEQPDEGRVLLDGRDISGDPPERRPTNLMFQSYALFPHMSVAANIGYGLRWTALRRAERAKRVDAMLSLLRLEEIRDRRPSQISGGQAQRTALARALARQPRVLLLDEPLGALDRRLREETQGELKALQRTLGTSFVVVTHDQAEAMALADRIAVLEAGRIAQIGRPREVYDRPASRFVAGFLGEINLFEGCVLDRSRGLAKVMTAASDRALVVACERDAMPDGAAVAVRPERMSIVLAGDDQAGSPELNSFEGTVAGQVFLGNAVSYRVRLATGQLLRVHQASTDVAMPIPDGARVRVGFPPQAAGLVP